MIGRGLGKHRGCPCYTHDTHTIQLIGTDLQATENQVASSGTNLVIAILKSDCWLKDNQFMVVADRVSVGWGDQLAGTGKSHDTASAT